MNKSQFAEELNAVMESMTGEEIEKAIEALSACKPDIHRHNSEEKAQLARRIKHAAVVNEDVPYVGENGKSGTLRIVGASLLTWGDYYNYRWRIPEAGCAWWLCDLNRAEEKVRKKDTVFSGKIRPTILFEGDPDTTFYIGKDKFHRLDKTLAIRESCLPGEFSVTPDEFTRFDSTERYKGEVVLDMCVDGWCRRLILSQKQQAM